MYFGLTEWLSGKMISCPFASAITVEQYRSLGPGKSDFNMELNIFSGDLTFDRKTTIPTEPYFIMSSMGLIRLIF